MHAAPSFSVRLLGTFEVRWERPAAPIELRRKTSAVLAYLAATNRPHPRRALIDMFCQDVDDPPGAFRSILSRLRRRVAPDVLLLEGNLIQFNREVCWADCLEFEHLLGNNPEALPLDDLITTIDLYRGEFLENLSLESSPEFEFWLLNERARYQKIYQNSLKTLVGQLAALGRIEAAILRAEKLVRSDPLMEDAHALLMRLYATNGQRQAALEQFERYRRYLRRELAVDPSPELAALREEISAGQLRPTRPAPAGPVELPPSAPAPAGLVGRQAELDQLFTAWRSSPSGYNRVVLLEAEAGMGKTRLVQEFANSVPEADFLTGECYESTRSLSYYPWLELLETRLNHLDAAALKQLSGFAADYLARLIPAFARRLRRRQPPLEPVSGDELNRLFSSIQEFLLELPGTPPIILFIDNLQWADDASLQLFHYLARRPSPGGVLLIGAVRTEEAGDLPALQAMISDLGRRSFLHLRLSPLSRAAIEELIAYLWPGLPEGYRPQVSDMLIKATGGNPLFVSEILSDLARTSHTPSTLPVPKSVRELTRRRLNRLPESSRQVIEALSILDLPATPELAQQASGRSQEETVTAIDLALRWGLLKPQSEGEANQYSFSHDLMREAVTGQITEIRRQLLHRRAALALEHLRAPAASLAHHWKMAGDPEKEAHFAVLAGEQAASIYANDEAVRYLERALLLIHEPEKSIRVMSRLGEVLQLIGRHQEAERVFQQALEAADTKGDRPAQAHFHVAMGKLKRLKGDYLQAISYHETALRIYRELGAQKGVVQALWGLGAVFWSQFDYPRAQASFLEQLEIARSLGDQKGIGAALGSLGLVYAEQGNYLQALYFYAERIQIDLQLGDRLSLAKTVGNLGILYAEQGEYIHALDCYRCLLQVTLELGDRRSACVAVGNMIGVFTELEDFQMAERLLRLALALGRALNIPLYLCDFLYNGGELYARQERYPQAQRLNEEALELASQIGQTDVQFSASLLSVRLRVATGQIGTKAAVDELEAMLEELPHDHQQAAVFYEMWRCDRQQPNYRQRAGDLYGSLFARTHNITYRQRYEELTGDRLPAAPPLPSPPDVVASNPVGLEMLLDQVEELVKNYQ